MKTYDIINAGPNKRFLANNRIVSNSGRLIQTQNLPRQSFHFNTGDKLKKDLTKAKNAGSDLTKLLGDEARSHLIKGSYEDLKEKFGSIPFVLSELVRTAFVPDYLKKFIVMDLASIEARVLAWLAGEQWKLDVFNTHGKIYEATASKMFKVPIETIDKESPYRQRGKVCDLLCGYGGGVGALINAGVLNLGIKEEELQGLIDMWRYEHPNTTAFWKSIQKTVVLAITNSGRKIPFKHGMYAGVFNNTLIIKLPSGRFLSYVNPKSDGWNLSYDGLNDKNIWTNIHTYGGKFTEQLCQAIARDVLSEAMVRIAAIYDIVFHVHDEIVGEVDVFDESAAEFFNQELSRPVPWAPGLPLAADGFECNYYRK